MLLAKTTRGSPGALRAASKTLPIQIDPQSVVEPLLTFSADHGGEMENSHAGICADRVKNGVTVANVARDQLYPGIGKRLWETRIEQDDFLDGLRLSGRTDERSTP